MYRHRLKKFKNDDFMGWAISQCPYPWAKQTEKNVQKHKKTRFFSFWSKLSTSTQWGISKWHDMWLVETSVAYPCAKKTFFRKSEKKHKECIRFAQGYALSAQNKIFHLRKGAQLFRSGLELVNRRCPSCLLVFRRLVLGVSDFFEGSDRCNSLNFGTISTFSLNFEYISNYNYFIN